MISLKIETMGTKDEGLIPDPKFSARTFFEAMIEGALSTMESVMDRKAAIFFLPIIGTSMFLIFFSNFIGLVPGFLPPSTLVKRALVYFSSACSMMAFVIDNIGWVER